MKVFRIPEGLPKVIDHRDLIIKQPTVLPYVTAGVNDLLGACVRSPECFSSIKFRLLVQYQCVFLQYIWSTPSSAAVNTLSSCSYFQVLMCTVFKTSDTVLLRSLIFITNA